MNTCGNLMGTLKPEGNMVLAKVKCCQTLSMTSFFSLHYVEEILITTFIFRSLRLYFECSRLKDRGCLNLFYQKYFRQLSTVRWG